MSFPIFILDEKPTFTPILCSFLGHVTCVSPGHGIGARQQVIEQYADAVDVRPHACRVALEHFRGEVKRRAGQVAGATIGGLPSGAKVHQYDAVVLREHHVLGLDVSMKQARFMHGRHSAAYFDAHPQCALDAELGAGPEMLLERATVNELHPEPDLPADLLGAVNRHDVGVTDAGEQPSFVNDRRGALTGERLRRQDLERDVPVQAGVPGAVDLTRGAGADSPEDMEMRPLATCNLPVRVGNGGEDLQLAQQVRIGAARFDRCPVDGVAIENRSRSLDERFMVRHASSPRRGARAPAARPCVPHLPSACRASPPFRRSCTPFPAWR